MQKPFPSNGWRRLFFDSPHSIPNGFGKYLEDLPAGLICMQRYPRMPLRSPAESPARQVRRLEERSSVLRTISTRPGAKLLIT